MLRALTSCLFVYQARLAALEAELMRRKNLGSAATPPALATAPAMSAAVPATAASESASGQASPPAPQGWEALLLSGNAAHASGDSRRAEELYTQALRELPTGAHAQRASHGARTVTHTCRRARRRAARAAG